MRHILVPIYALLIGAFGCSADPAAPPLVDGPLAKGGWMSATADGDPWNAWNVSVSKFPAGISIEGTDWMTDESTIAIRLFIRTDAGIGEQPIGMGSGTVAEVMYRPWYEAPQNWTVSNTMGGGAVTLETLSDNRATGTFSFTAKAVSAATQPATYHVTRGSFDIRF